MKKGVLDILNVLGNDSGGSGYRIFYRTAASDTFTITVVGKVETELYQQVVVVRYYDTINTGYIDRGLWAVPNEETIWDFNSIRVGSEIRIWVPDVSLVKELYYNGERLL